MRTRTVIGDGLTVVVRGRHRRTSALADEYLVSLKNQPDMAKVPAYEIDVTDKSQMDAAEAKFPRGWSLLTSAESFRNIAARCSSVTFDGEPELEEPFSGPALIRLFEHWLDIEIPPDASDVWSRVRQTIVDMDTTVKGEPSPEAGSAMQTELPN